MNEITRILNQRSALTSPQLCYDLEYSGRSPGDKKKLLPYR